MQPYVGKDAGDRPGVAEATAEAATAAREGGMATPAQREGPGAGRRLTGGARLRRSTRPRSEGGRLARGPADEATGGSLTAQTAELPAKAARESCGAAGHRRGPARGDLRPGY